MKTVKKKAEIENIAVSCCNDGKFEYIFNHGFPFKNYNSIEVFHEVEEPETMKEFLEVNKTTKKELVKWLNENYK